MAAFDHLDHLVCGPGDRRLLTAREDDPRRMLHPACVVGGNALACVDRTRAPRIKTSEVDVDCGEPTRATPSRSAALLQLHSGVRGLWICTTENQARPVAALIQPHLRIEHSQEGAQHG